MNRGTIEAEITWGMAAGLLGTVVMDLVIVGFFAATGMPPGLVYSFIGDVAQQGLLRIGVAVAGGVALGALVHFLLGVVLGAVFGLAVSRIPRLRLGSVVKGALLGVLYIEIVSQPILVMAPLLMTMNTSEVLQWYVLSTSMHVIYGIVLGVAMALRQRWKPLSQRVPQRQTGMKTEQRADKI
jgi:uncharacterized membrane protein YagU involved in acid resistance